MTNVKIDILVEVYSDRRTQIEKEQTTTNETGKIIELEKSLKFIRTGVIGNSSSRPSYKVNHLQYCLEYAV